MTDFEPTETLSEPPTSRRRRRRTMFVVPASLAVVAGSVWAGMKLAGNDSASTDPRASAPEGVNPASEPTVPPLRMVLPEPPDGYELQWVQDPADLRKEDFGTTESNRVILLAKPDATLATGGWIAVTTRVMDRFERPRYDPANDGQLQSPKSFTLGEMKAAVGKTWEGLDSLSFGPVNDGFAVNVAGVDVSQAVLTEIAGLIDLDDDGRATMRDAPVLAGYSPLGVFERTWGVQGVIDGNDPLSTMNVSYGPPDGSSSIGVVNFPSPSRDPLAVAKFFLKDPVDGVVHGQPAVAGDLASLQPVGGQPARVMWVEDGRLVSLNANMPAAELLALAETTRVATDDEWTQLKELWRERQNAMEQPGEPIDTWLIAAGELEDSTTWVAEGGYDDEGGWLYALSTMSARGSMLIGGSFNKGVEVQYPAILPYPSEQQGGLKAGKVAVIIALVETATAEGSTLRFTPDGGGAPLEAPLHKIRDDWAAWSAALAFLAESGGTAEVVGADGTVIRSETIKVAEAADGAGAEGAPATAVAASG